MNLRSLLYVPADNQAFIDKAHTRGADAIILDLEDSVLPDRKNLARKNLSQSIASAGQAGAKVFVRINSKIDDALIDAKAAHEGGAFGLYVSKANVEKLNRLSQVLPGRKPPLALVALVEDPSGVLNAESMARLTGVAALSLGGEDLATAMGADPTPEVLRLPRQLVHYAAKAHGLMSIGLFQSTADYSDTEALAQSAREARAHGFDGASCIHPSAVPILNAAFDFSDTERDWARRVIAAASGTKSGAFSLDGKMVDAPVLARARRILDASQN